MFSSSSTQFQFNTIQRCRWYFFFFYIGYVWTNEFLLSISPTIPPQGHMIEDGVGRRAFFTSRSFFAFNWPTIIFYRFFLWYWRPFVCFYTTYACEFFVRPCLPIFTACLRWLTAISIFISKTKHDSFYYIFITITKTVVWYDELEFFFYISISLCAGNLYFIELFFTTNYTTLMIF